MKSGGSVVKCIHKSKKRAFAERAGFKYYPDKTDKWLSTVDLMKDEVLSQADRLFMHYLANQAGLPQYYYPMLNIGEEVAMILFGIGFANLLFQKNLIKKIIGFNIMDTAIYLFLAEKGYSKEFGARNIARTVENYISANLVDEVLFGKLSQGGKVICDSDKNPDSDKNSNGIIFRYETI